MCGAIIVAAAVCYSFVANEYIIPDEYIRYTLG